jgi:IS5 family transposase
LKTVTEILGGAQGLLDISFDLQTCFEETLNDQQKTFLHMLRCLEEHLIVPERAYAGTGRKPYQYAPFLKSQFAKSVFQISTTSKLIERLKADPNLRLLCGFRRVPGKASFSRALGYLAETIALNQTLESLAKETFNAKVVYHVCRDSTAIHAREKAEKKKGKTPQTTPKKTGRPPKSEGKREKPPGEMEKQLTEEPCVSLKRLNKKCTYGFKQSSRGKHTFWKGYKLHLDVSDSGFPITAFVTGANVQDCFLAIPMEKVTEQRVTFCYSLMDKGYDANILHSFIKSRERVPIIDLKKRNNGFCPELDPAKRERYKIRSTVERANSHLKDMFIPRAIYVKGYTKVSFVLLCAVLCLAALKHLQFLC